MLLQTGFQINELGHKLGLEEGVLELVYDTMKHIICEEPGMLEGRHLDQLILCGMYVVGLMQKTGVKFQEIIQTYQEVNPYNREAHLDIIHKINHQGAEINLVSYYNEVFIKHVKGYIVGLKAAPHHHQPNHHQNALLMSPLKEILPRDINKKKRKTNKDGNTNLLMACSDSPLLKHEPISFKAPQQSHKVIDFEQEEQ